MGTGRFIDVDDNNIFKADIEWLAANGITRGRNPPDNTEFCPAEDVTRQQMAAFLYRFAKSRSVDAGTIQGLTAAELQGQTGLTGPQGSQAIQVLTACLPLMTS